MTTFRLVQNRAGHWDIFVGRGAPVVTFLTLPEALDHMQDLARIRTMAMQVVIEFDQPGKYRERVAKGFFEMPA